MGVLGGGQKVYFEKFMCLFRFLTKQLIEMPTSTMALMGRFPSLMGRCPTLVGRFPNLVLSGRFIRSEKLQNESFPNFSNFRPEFCPNFAPIFSQMFRASFRGRRRTEKNHQKSLPLFKAKFPGKHEENIRKNLLESRQGNVLPLENPLENSPLRKGALRGS